MKIYFDKDQWEIDSESLHPLREVEKYNHNKSLLGYVLMFFIASLLFVFFLILSPIIVLNSIKVIK